MPACLPGCSCDTGNPVITPAHMLRLLRSVAAASNGGAEGEGEGEGEALAITHVHRSDIALRPPSVPRPDLVRLSVRPQYL